MKYPTYLVLKREESNYRALDFFIEGPGSTRFALEGEGEKGTDGKAEYGFDIRIASHCCAVGWVNETAKDDDRLHCLGCNTRYEDTRVAPSLMVVNYTPTRHYGPAIGRDAVLPVTAWLDDAFQWQDAELDPLDAVLQAAELAEYLVDLAWRNQPYLAWSGEPAIENIPLHEGSK